MLLTFAEAEDKCENDSCGWEVEVWFLECVAVNAKCCTQSGCLIGRDQGAMIQTLHKHNQLAGD